MTISERLQRVIDALHLSIDDCRDALKLKGVEMPDAAKFNTIADYIRLIFQSDFEWMFNFQDIDQFGNPRTPNKGQPIAPNTVSQFYNPEFVFDGNLMLFDFDIENVFVNKHNGMFGTYDGLQNPISSEFAYDNSLIEFDFNENIYPEQFHQDTTI